MSLTTAGQPGKARVKDLDSAIGARLAFQQVLGDMAPSHVMSKPGRQARKIAATVLSFLDQAIKTAQAKEGRMARMLSSRGSKQIDRVLRVMQARSNPAREVGSAEGPS